MANSEKVRQIAESYGKLTHEERHEFVALLSSVDEGEVSQEWVAELRSRADDIDSGRVQLVDGEDVMRRLRTL